MRLHLLVAISLGSLVACTPLASDGFSDVLPDERVQVNMPTDSAQAKEGEDREWSEYYLLTAGVTDSVNGLIGGVLLTIDAVTDLPPTYQDEEENHAYWGPWADALDPVETALGVEYDPEADTYDWYVVQKPKGAEDEDFVAVIAGHVDAGATHEENSGYFCIDFTTANELDPNSTAVGAFCNAYDVDPDGVSAEAAFEGFSDGGQEVDALYYYDQTHGGDGAMDLGWVADFTGNGEDELHIVRSRWTSVGEGRSDAALTGGELGEAAVFVSECWGTSFEAVYRTDSWSGAETGDVNDCPWTEADWSEREDSES